MSSAGQKVSVQTEKTVPWIAPADNIVMADSATRSAKMTATVRAGVIDVSEDFVIQNLCSQRCTNLAAEGANVTDVILGKALPE